MTTKTQTTMVIARDSLRKSSSALPLLLMILSLTIWTVVILTAMGCGVRA